MDTIKIKMLFHIIQLKAIKYEKKAFETHTPFLIPPKNKNKIQITEILIINFFTQYLRVKINL